MAIRKELNMDKELTLDEMYLGLLNDKRYALKNDLRSNYRLFKEGRLRYYTGGSHEIHLVNGEHDAYFGYTHFGSSAVTAEKDQLEWLLKTIFKADPSDFAELNYDTIMDVINEGR